MQNKHEYYEFLWEGFVNELHVQQVGGADENEAMLIAHKDMIYLLPSEHGGEISEKEANMLWDRLGLRDSYYDEPETDIDEIFAAIREEGNISIIAGSIKDGILYLDEPGVTQRDPQSSVAIKKLVKALNLKVIIRRTMDAYDYDEEEYSAHSAQAKLPNRLYHGTSTKYLKSILKYGLMPDKAQSNYAEQGIEHPHDVFFSSKFDEAEHHAKHTVVKIGGGDPMVITLRVPDPDKLIPDYDVGISATAAAEKPMAMSKEVGIYGYRGRIPANHIDEYCIVPNLDFEGTPVDSISNSEYQCVTREEAVAYVESTEEVGIGFLDPDWRDEYMDDEDDGEYLNEWQKFELSTMLNEQVTGRSMEAWNRLGVETQNVVRQIAKYADSRTPIRILYRPKVTTNKAVYRTVHPYSLRIRDVHVNGYHTKKVPTVVLFAYDMHNRMNPNPGNEKPTIKNFVADRIITVRPMRGKYQDKWDVEMYDDEKAGEGEE